MYPLSISSVFSCFSTFTVLFLSRLGILFEKRVRPKRLYFLIKIQMIMFYFSKNLLFFLQFLPLACVLAQSETSTDFSDSTKINQLRELTVTATMATSKMPLSFTNLNQAKIQARDFGQDLPFILKSTPSVVETSDAGTGIGYTGLRIRGSDASRTNVTIDGVPLNESESQLVYWVNIPDFLSSTTTVQIQRGVGTSTNGAGAFGASINLITNGLQSEKYLNYSGGFGSFNTQRHTLAAGTGLIGGKWAFDVRGSLIASDGYVDRARSDLKSFYASGLYLAKNTSVKLKVFHGHEETYQSWYGISPEFVNDSKLRTYNPAGFINDSTFYDNQVDNYRQTHAHLTLNHKITEGVNAQVSLHYTRGLGFYEEYRVGEVLQNYFAQFLASDTSDLVRRLWLDNHFYGAVWNLHFQKNKWDATLGGGINRYDGEHFGDVIWSALPTDFAETKPRFYFSEAQKTDFNAFFKANYAFSPILNAYLDVQYRRVAHNTEGSDRRKIPFDHDLTWNFFNPKIGLVVQNSARSRFHASFGVAHREPNRNDILDVLTGTIPSSEQLLNTELGWQGAFKTLNLGVNFYQMYYNNQLVVTGKINDVGEQVRVNVPKSYRLGVELSAEWQIFDRLSLDYNLTLSQNKVLNFKELRDNFDTFIQEEINHGTTDIAFSPNLIANAVLTYKIFEKGKNEFDISLIGKHVGAQFVDNTSNTATQLPDYRYADMRFQYKTNFGKIKNLTCKLLINNVLDTKFSANAWAYRYVSGGEVVNSMGLFPQAGRHFLVGVSIGF